ncbi:unnamed protein product [Mytilus edulis]|uniref:Endonuclease n=1 Tax=Mytilus edulis TaxID=6550 RepID=A0A8S3TF56_MYTED|nr:unnamed protein product [Mytilus edulis]
MKPRGKRSDVRQFNTLSTDESDSEYEIMAVETDDVNVNMIQNKIFARMLLIDENKEVKFQLDSGATANLIPRSYHIHSQIESGNDRLTMYNQSTMKSYGTCMLRVKNPKTHKRYKVKFIVVDDKYTPLLGAKAIQAMNLIKIQFQNIMGEGTFKGAFKLEIDESIPPVKSPLRRIPIALKPKLKTELQRLEKLGVIKPVDTPTDWVSSLVIVKKPSGKIRLCIDPKPLNKALKRCHYPLPIIEDLLPELSKAKVYSKCDVKNGFWHVNLADESSFLTTFETPFGRYRWTKMPFGISPAPEYFQQFLEREIENLPGVRTVADDIIIYGEGQTIENATLDHDRKLKALLDRCRERNIKINREKLVLRATEMPYIGHLLTAEGVKPDPEKIAAIVNMEKPTDVKGVQRLLADTLSRAYLRSTDGNESKTQDEILLVRSDIEVEVEQINMTDYLAITEERQKLIAQSTQQDKTLQQLIKTIENGWNNSEHPSELDPFYNVRDELSVQNGIIFKGDRCIIPNAMRNEILSQIHTHIGIEGCLKRARECVYWPRMNSELRDYISKCDVCQSLAMKQPKETLKSHDVPSRPWAKIGTDLFTLSGNDYLITVDYYSSFFEVDRLYDTSSKTVINKLKQHFARWGIPETVISDNGPQYSSEQFKQFSKQWDFQHKTSSLGHAQSNGKVENAVKTAKRLMRKAKKSNSDPYIALLNFRNTPQQVTKYSPVQQMINRRTRTLLPMKSALFESKIPENVRSNIMDNKKRQEKYYNRSARDLNELKQGEIVN